MAINKNQRFKEDYDYRLYRIKHYGKKYGWNFLSETTVLVFNNKEAILTINPKELTIETELKHPVKGETKLLRQGNFTMNMIEAIFRNPRTHTPDQIRSQYLP